MPKMLPNGILAVTFGRSENQLSGNNDGKTVTKVPPAASPAEETFDEWEKGRPTVQELSSLAAKGVRPQDGLTYYERLLWYELRDIYSDWKNKTSTEEALKARKQDAVSRYDKLRRIERTHSEDMRRVADLFKAIEAVGIAYRKDRTLENADRLMNVVYGLLGGE